MAGDLDRTVSLTVELDAEQAENGFRRLSNAAGEVGSKATPSIARLNQQIIQMGVRFQETGQIGTRSLANIGVQLKTLEQQYGQTARGVDQLTKAEREFLTSARGAYDQAIIRQREFNDELQRVQRQTRDWTGLEGALGSLGGTLGTVAKAAFGVAAAFTAGWQAGERLDKWLEGNVENWTKWKDKISENVLKDPVIRWMFGLGGKPAEQGLTQRAKELTAGMDLAGTTPAAEEVVDYEQQLMADFYKESLRRQKEARDESLRQQRENLQKSERLYEDYVKRISQIIAGKGDEFYRNFPGGFGQFVEQRGVTVSPSPIIGGDVSGSIAEMEQFLARYRDEEKAFSEALTKENLDRWRTGMEAIGKQFSDLLTKGLGNALSQAFSTGDWVTFGQQMGGAFMEIVGAEGGLSETLVDALVGIKRDAQGRYSFQGGPAGTREQAMGQFAQKYADVLAAAGGALTGYANMSKYMQQFESTVPWQKYVLQANLQGVATLLSTGNWIAGAVTAIVGAITARIRNAQIKAQWPYGVPGVTAAGEATFGPGADPEHFKNISKERLNEILAAIQDSFDNFYNGYMKILLKFPNEVIPNILKTIDGKFQPEATAEFFQNLEMWISGTMPREIASRFGEAISTAFVDYGFSAEQFKKIWTHLQSLDPEKALELLGKLADGIIDIYNALAFLKLPSGFGGEGVEGFGFGFGTQRWEVTQEHFQDFADTLAEADKQTLRLVEAWNLLTGEAQIDATKDIGKALVDRVQKIKEAFQQLADALDQVNRSIDEQIQGYRLAGMKPGEQVSYLKQRADILYQQLQHAPNLAEAQRIEAELQRIIDMIVQAGGATPEFLEWGEKQLELVRTAFAQKIEEFGEAIDRVNDEFMERFGPAYDLFTQGLEDAGTESTDFADSVDRGREAIDKWTEAIDKSTNVVAGPWGGGTSDERRGGTPYVTGSLDIYVNDQSAGSVNLRQQGFVRRTAAARSRR